RGARRVLRTRSRRAHRRTAGRLSLPRVDLARIGRELPYRLRNVWILAQYQQPTPGAGDPALPQPPSPDQVNHMQYAIEWFAFALIPLIGWPIVLWRVARRGERPAVSP
ncbi:MAG TPA: SURF1 family cytochrome oxidase biogenesis protein, partial [Acidimicrobiia bacterium]|nr:SURF1 family cytochrome oxidase biogenesis protein [Acidimicrobiia bacterium]